MNIGFNLANILESATRGELASEFGHPYDQYEETYLAIQKFVSGQLKHIDFALLDTKQVVPALFHADAKSLLRTYCKSRRCLDFSQGSQTLFAAVKFGMLDSNVLDIGIEGDELLLDMLLLSKTEEFVNYMMVDSAVGRMRVTNNKFMYAQYVRVFQEAPPEIMEHLFDTGDNPTAPLSRAGLHQLALQCATYRVKRAMCPRGTTSPSILDLAVYSDAPYVLGNTNVLRDSSDVRKFPVYTVTMGEDIGANPNLLPSVGEQVDVSYRTRDGIVVSDMMVFGDDLIYDPGSYQWTLPVRMGPTSMVVSRHNGSELHVNF